MVSGRPVLGSPGEGSAMHCFDCAKDKRVVVALAVCRHCGAAVCEQHARVAEVAAQRPAGLAPGVPVRATRLMTCGVCREPERPGGRVTHAT
ncbi:hypothetical protein ACFQVC_03375 [Streptomyces monticola]|uniref:DUF2180 family protein n=1 Tax=Streptomyces monticola TaxID=2666263 RepID=A0ABW2JC29_9ACTN